MEIYIELFCLVIEAKITRALQRLLVIGMICLHLARMRESVRVREGRKQGAGVRRQGQGGGAEDEGQEIIIVPANL